MQCSQGARQKRDRRRHPRVNHLCGVVILAWLFPLAALLLAVLRPRSTKTCVSLLPWSLAVDLGCWPYPLSYSFASSEHTRTARPAPRVPFGGRLSEIYSSDPPRLPFLQPPLSPLVAQSDDPLERSNDTAGTRACRSRDFSWSTSVSLAMLNCVLRDTG